MPIATPSPQARMLAALRTEAGMSLRELARDLGISHSHLHRIESGERPLTPALAHAASEAIGNHLTRRHAT